MTLDFNSLFPTINKISATGIIRTKPQDFKVTELNDIELSGAGEHLWLYIEKIDSNTDWVAKQLSNVCQTPRRQVGFAGLKDRHAVTQQWFSIQLPKISDIEKIQSALPDAINIIDHGKHSKKIKVGQLNYNQFEIVIRNIKSNDKNDNRNNKRQQIEKNIQNIKDDGVPNYFGPQRFGHDMGNIQKAQDWFSGSYKVKTKNLKSILISTARSHIFNTIVAQRINEKTWDTAITGDILQLNKSHSWFAASDASATEIAERLKVFDIHLTAAMWGEDQTQSTESCAILEKQIAALFPIYQQGFEKFRLKQDRRAMRICPIDLEHEWINDNLKLTFKLLPGAYATGIIREILDFHVF